MTPADQARPSTPTSTAGRWARDLGVIVLGAAVGTAIRAGLTTAFPDDPSLPLTTLAINVTGAFALGLLLESLVRTGPDEGRRRGVRLLAGTGLLGGYTTYSALAVQLAQQLLDGTVGTALQYAGLTIVVGLAGAALGVVAGRAIAGRRAR